MCSMKRKPRRPFTEIWIIAAMSVLFPVCNVQFMGFSFLVCVCVCVRMRVCVVRTWFLRVSDYDSRKSW